MGFKDMENKEKGEYLLAILRIAIGWMMLWPFFDKLFGLGFETPAGQGWIDGTSPSSFVVYMTDGLFKGLFESLAGNIFIDCLMMAGLLIIGITVTLGFASKLTSIAMTGFLIMMYLICVPPTDNPLIDYHITWILAIWVIYFLGGYDRLSIKEKWNSLSIVQRFPILQ